MDFKQGDLVWFDPGVGHLMPGEVTEIHRAGQVVTVQALVAGKPQLFTLNDMSSLRRRQDVGVSGVDDMTELTDVHDASVLWNLKTRYEQDLIYTYAGNMLISINPYQMHNIYGLDIVRRYEGEVLGSLPPHIFAIASAAYVNMIRQRRGQVIVMTGVSGSGKTECAKLVQQYLAAVNKSPSNLVTEQILEATPLLESFGNAKTALNDNASRFGKYLEIYFKDGMISGARVTPYLLDKWRVVSHGPEERTFHVFYEMLAGLSESERSRYGLQTADHYFYLNQGSNLHIDGKLDSEDFQSLLSSLQVLGFSVEEQEVIFKILSSVLHLGNIYFHKATLRSGQETVEMGSDAEVRWMAFLLALNPQTVRQSLISRSAESCGESVVMPLKQSQALDVRDSLARLLYAGLFNWLVERVNTISFHGNRKMSISLLDMFGFEKFQENSFEQLCINYTNEQLQQLFIKISFQQEQQEYAREKIHWQPLSVQDNSAILQLISKKSTGLFTLLDDECNFPKATDSSLLDKFHFNHALNDLYSRSREVVLEFSIHHYAGVVNYSVDGFLEKNRDIVRHNLLELLLNSQSRVIVDMFEQFAANSGTLTPSSSKVDNRFVTMKPRSPTIAARYHDNLHQLLESVNRCQPWFVRCLRPTSRSSTVALETTLLQAQLRQCTIVDAISMRKRGYPVWHSFTEFSQRYRCLVSDLDQDVSMPALGVRSPGHRVTRSPRSCPPSRDLCRLILEQNPSRCLPASVDLESFGGMDQIDEDFQLGITSVLLRERYSHCLEQQRRRIMTDAAVLLQSHVRRYLASRRLHTMQSAAVRVQSAFRMYRQRYRYQQLRSGVVRAQAQYRMLLQRRRFLEMKDELKQRLLAEREARRKSAQHLQNGERRSGGGTGTGAVNDLRSRHAVVGVSHLDMPDRLVQVFNQIDDWEPVHTDRNLVKLNSVVDPPEERFSLPHDIDYHSFTKFANVNFKSHLWGMKREPIRTPLLCKSRDIDYSESLSIFRLILRFMNEEDITSKREKALGDYIVYKGLTNVNLRDEILCQLCNQTCKNPNSVNAGRGWLLLSNCLSVFPPSDALYKYLLKYVSDHGPNGYAADCQKKLLRSPPDGRLSRKYPPSLLEWKCNKKKFQMALEAVCADGLTCFTPVDSWTTGEEMAAYVLENRGIGATFGWTVRPRHCPGVNSDDDFSAAGARLSDTEVSCVDYVLDSVAGREMMPLMLGEKIPATVSSPPPSTVPDHADICENSNNNNNRLLSNGSQGDFDSDTIDMDTGLDSGDCGDDEANSPQSVNQQPSLTRIKGHGGIALSTSQLYSKPLRGGDRRASADLLIPSTADRTAEQHVTAAAGGQRKLEPTHDVLDSARSRSLDNLLDGGDERHGRLTDADRMTSRNVNDLSQSRLNSRYHSADVINNPANHRAANRNGWSQYGLSESVLNGRYFTSRGRSAELESQPGVFHESSDRGRYMTEEQLDTRAIAESSHKVIKGSRGHQHSPSRRVSGTVLSGRDLGSNAVKSSAMSDTSEAPSLASHVRRVRVPSQTSDMDQYVDELFSPMLDEPALEDLTDARALAASIRGESCQMISHLTSFTADIGSDANFVEDTEYCQSIELEELYDFNCWSSQLSGLADEDVLAHTINGEAEPTAQSANQMMPQYLMQPMAAPGLNAASPLVLPTPLPFTQSPGGMSLPAMLSGTRLPSDGIPANISTADPQQMALYQQMFIQTAVAQNMQLQQQLLSQNQALTQLLQASAGQSTSLLQPISPPEVSPVQMVSTTDPEALGRATADSAPGRAAALGKQSRSVEDLSMFSDPSHTRARTVRIGKWRWPPLVTPGGSLANQSERTTTTSNEDFLEFKLRAKQRRNYNQRSLSSGDLLEDNMERPLTVTSEGELVSDWTKQPATHESDNCKQSSASELSQNSSDTADHNDAHSSPVLRIGSMADQGSVTEQVNRLKISSTLKQKLEAVTSQNRSEDTPDSARESVDAPSHRSVRKLDASRRLLLERKLSGVISSSADTHSESTVWNNKKSPGNKPPSDNSNSTSNDQQPVSARTASSHPTHPLHIQIPPPSTTGLPEDEDSSSDSSPDMLHDWSPPRPIQPIREGRSRPSTNQKSAYSSHAETSHGASKYEVEESDEFLSPIDSYGHLDVSRDHDDPGQTTDLIQTELYPPSTAPFITYAHVPWKLDIRKEVFSPTEDVTNATALHLVFCQIVKDVFDHSCIRITPSERQQMQQWFDEMGISPDTISSPQIKLALKRRILEVAKQWPTYFCLFFTITVSSIVNENQLLGLSHSGIYLIKVVTIDGIKLTNKFLQILDHIRFQEVLSVDAALGDRVQLVLSNGVHHVLATEKATVVADMLDRFIAEARSGTHEYMRALTNYQSNDPSLLSFKKGDLIRIIKKSNNSQPGWLFGILDGKRGLLPVDCVVSVPNHSDRKLLSTSTANRADSEHSHDSPTDDTSPAVTSSDWLVRDVTEPPTTSGGNLHSSVSPPLADDGKHSLLQFAMIHFRDADEKYNMLRSEEGETNASVNTKNKKNKKKAKAEWTWREQVEMVKWTSNALERSLLKLESPEMNRLALECFTAIQRYMGEQVMPQGTTEVDCVYSILMSCHRYPSLRDEIYCQLMRQTTSNRSVHGDSCQRGWRLLGMVAAYFSCSDQLKPYLFKYLETAAHDKRRAYHGTALVCLQNLRKTVRHGGRKNVPSVEEITAVTAGRNSKRQLYRLPGGTERVINTKSCSVVQDIIEQICEAINITNTEEMNEYSLYCIVEGDTFTMPLAREEYILDVTTELQKNDQIFYLIFCRSVWFFPLRLSSQLYVEVVFNQITPDYLEGLLLVMPGETLQEQVVYDISRVAALLHRAADMDNMPNMKETKYLLPKAALMVRDIKPPQWVNMVQSSWVEIQQKSAMQAKGAVLEILESWPLFGSSFFAVSRVVDSCESVDHILALNRAGVHFLDTVTHETLAKYPFSEVISTRKVKTEDGTLFLDMKCGNLMMQKVVRIQSDNAHEISRLIRQYISIEQRQRITTNDGSTALADSSREGQASR